MTESEDSLKREGEVVPMYLISQAQRQALLEFLGKQPYMDVASGIDFLRQAPMINVSFRDVAEGTTDVEVVSDRSDNDAAE
jgi:hypothetical protein